MFKKLSLNSETSESTPTHCSQGTRFITVDRHSRVHVGTTPPNHHSTLFPQDENHLPDSSFDLNINAVYDQGIPLLHTAPPQHTTLPLQHTAIFSQNNSILPPHTTLPPLNFATSTAPPTPLLDHHMKEVAQVGGVEGRVWRRRMVAGLVLYDITHNRWCRNVQRFHKSNNVRYVFVWRGVVWCGVVLCGVAWCRYVFHCFFLFTTPDWWLI